MRRWFSKAVLSRSWAAFLVMGLAFFCFGIGTLNIFMLLKGTFELLADYGWQAATDGGLWQLAELLVSGYASMAGYLVFKACEHSLVRGITRPESIADDPSEPGTAGDH